MKIPALIAALLLPLAAAPSLASTLYKCTDASGVVLYANEKITGKNCELLASMPGPVNIPSSKKSNNSSSSARPQIRARTGSGSGFWISDGSVVTNNHVIRDCKKIVVGKQKTPATILRSNPSVDVAVLAVPGASRRTRSVLRNLEARLGEEVLISGYPLGGLIDSSVTVTTGTVSSATPFGKAHIFQTTAPIQPGSSGGPIFDSGGKVIGMVVGSLNSVVAARATGHIPQNVNFGIRISKVMEVLDEAKVAYQIEPPGNKKLVHDIADEADRVTAQVFCEG